MSNVRFLFLGTATSVGVPVIGCDCPVCTSGDPRNIRTRSSALLSGPFGEILIDSGPDLREQALREVLTEIDAVLYTHAHLDHIAGFDELRAFCWRRDEPLPMYGSRETLDALKQMYGWAFSPENTYKGYIKPDAREFDDAFDFRGLKITPIKVLHGSVRTHGFRFDYPGHQSLAYLPDVKSIPQASLDKLQNLDILIIDSLRYEDHATHLTVTEAQEIAKQLNPAHTYFTHLSHDLDFHALDASLNENQSSAFDGLTLSL